jgi:hypothetical protein
MERAVKLAFILSAALLAACASSAGADGKITITKAVADNFEGYKAWLTSTGNGYYAVTEDGQGAYGWGCPEARCRPGPSAREQAIKACESANPGRKCIIFAEGRDPVVEYSVGN